jgi:hypothetical protein
MEPLSPGLLLDESNPCAYMIVYEYLNVRDVVSVALGQATPLASRDLLMGYVRMLTRHCRQLLRLFDENQCMPTLIRLLRWLRWMPTQGLDASRPDPTRSWILNSYSNRFMPWYASIVPHIQSTLFHAYRIEILSSVYAGLSLCPVVSFEGLGPVHIELPRHTFEHPHKPGIVCATFASRGGVRGISWDLPLNAQHHHNDRLLDALSRKRIRHDFIPTEALAGSNGLQALILTHRALYHTVT